ncbi:hypothetical protein LCGC14_2392170, partial [marine sediment metagenome]
MATDAVNLRRKHVLDTLQHSPGGLYWEDISRALGITGMEAKESAESLVARGKVELVNGKYIILPESSEVEKTSAGDQRGAAEGREHLQAAPPSPKKDLEVIDID